MKILKQREHWPSARAVSGGPRRFALIIGAMKAGTTSLFELLAQHPEVAASRTKEPNFFVSHSDPVDAWAEYLTLWDWAPERHRIALEASVAYAKSPWVPDIPRRIHSVSGVEFRFIYMTRYPPGRIESQVRHAIYEGWGESLDNGGFTEDLLDFSRYASQLDRYLEFFPRESILVLTVEELRESPSEVLRRCCHFLGIADDFVFRGENERHNAGDFYSVPAVVGALARSGKVRSIAGLVLPRWVHHRLRGYLGRKLEGHRSLGRWRLTAQETEQVLQELAPDFRRLKTEFGVDVERFWSIPGAPLRFGTREASALRAPDHIRSPDRPTGPPDELTA